METTKIKTNIDEAVRVFRESLENTYLKENRPFHGIGVHSLMNFFQGKINVTRKNDGNLRLSGELGKALFKEECKGLPRSFEDYDIYPLVITLFNKEFEQS